MSKILILVEGQTEERFVKEVINPHIMQFDKYAVPIIATTKHSRQGAKHKGGITSYDKVKKQVIILLQDSSATLVTTMIDYYKLPEDFPGKNNLPVGDCFSKVMHLEREFGRDINNPKFIPYFQLHEFESLLFCSADGFRKTFPRHKKDAQVNRIINQFQTPEEIDDGDTTSPAKRIVSLFPESKHVLHGVRIAIGFGLAGVISKCRHFDEWVQRLEA